MLPFSAASTSSIYKAHKIRILEPRVLYVCIPVFHDAATSDSVESMRITVSLQKFPEALVAQRYAPVRQCFPEILHFKMNRRIAAPAFRRRFRNAMTSSGSLVNFDDLHFFEIFQCPVKHAPVDVAPDQLYFLLKIRKSH